MKKRSLSLSETCLEFNIPITKPLKPNSTADGSMRRIRSIVRASCTGLLANPGARMCRTINGAKIAANNAVRVKISNIRLAIADANFQAPRLSSFTNKLVNVGIKAEANAPPATRVNSVSETRLAAINASISPLVPKAFSTSTCRASPTMLFKANAAITSPAARAIWRLAVPCEVSTEKDYINALPDLALGKPTRSWS